jgi:hypothetical protein
MSLRRTLACAAAATGAITAVGLAVVPAAQAGATRPAAYHSHPSFGFSHRPFLSHFSQLSTITSTVPGNGDQNPYGVFVIRHSTGMLQAGDVLVSNFNNMNNLQGTGSTIVQVNPDGQQTQFASISPSSLPGPCPGGVGLTTALEVLPGGWVVVGSTPSTNGMAATSEAGCLIVLNSDGQVVETIHGHGINGPWDSALAVHGRIADLFVANVLNGTVAGNGNLVNRGTVLRLTLLLHRYGPPSLAYVAKVGSGYPEETNSTTFVEGPTGLGLGRDGTLYVAETPTSQIFAIHGALFRSFSTGPGQLVTSGGKLNMPLGMAIAPNGDVLTVNGGDGRIVETTPYGSQIASMYLDSTGTPPGNGALFGLAVGRHRTGIYYVDDDTNTLNLLH